MSHMEHFQYQHLRHQSVSCWNETSLYRDNSCKASFVRSDDAIPVHKSACTSCASATRADFSVSASGMWHRFETKQMFRSDGTPVASFFHFQKLYLTALPKHHDQVHRARSKDFACALMQRTRRASIAARHNTRIECSASTWFSASALHQ